MRRRIVAIVNPIAGARHVVRVTEQVERFVVEGGGTFRLYETAHAGHATVLASELDSRADAVLVVGGDGTVREVAGGLIDRPIPMAVLGAGTENLLARELHMPTTPRELATLLLFGESFPYDVGVVNGLRFLVVAGVGFDAECVERLTRIRRGHITHMHYFWPIWRTFLEHRFPCLSIEADGEEVFHGRGLALVGNAGRYSLGLRILNRARSDDGRLDLCVLPCATRLELLAHVYRVLRGRHTEARGVVYRQCRRIRISSPAHVPMEVDGDTGGALPADFTILAGAVRFLRGTSSSQSEKGVADGLTNSVKNGTMSGGAA